MKIGAVTRAGPVAASSPPAPATAHELDALHHLNDLAEGDTRRSRHRADALPAWWSAEGCGLIGPSNLRGVDRDVVVAMRTVFGSLAYNGESPLRLEEAFDAAFRALVRSRRRKAAG